VAHLHEKTAIPEQHVCANFGPLDPRIRDRMVILRAVFARRRKLALPHGEKDGVYRLIAAQ
jgi:hypothetical protein